jgi:hypothetical protein
MREIRARVSERHGIDLSNQQIQELAARRLEAILDPRGIKPSLMDELRRAAGLPADAAPAEPLAENTFKASDLYESPNKIVRFIRRLFNPLLRLLFNPDALVQAFDAQARLNKAAAAREAEQRRRQTEWNGLHFEILRRLVTDLARTDIESQQLALRVESLAGKVDFNERRVRTFEQTQHQSKPVVRAAETGATPPALAPSREDVAQSERAPSSEGAPESGRRRRRRRRGRRSGGGQGPDLGVASAGRLASGFSPDLTEQADSDDAGDDDLASEGPSGDGAEVSGRPDVLNSGFQGAETRVEPLIEAVPTPDLVTTPTARPGDSGPQGSGIGDQGSGIRDLGSGTGSGPGNMNQEEDRRSLNPDPGFPSPGPTSED